MLSSPILKILIVLVSIILKKKLNQERYSGVGVKGGRRKERKREGGRGWEGRKGEERLKWLPEADDALASVVSKVHLQVVPQKRRCYS